jgi:uncharacterized protein
MKPSGSALYTGKVTHCRLRPRQHRLRYRIFYLLLDLDEIEHLARSLRLFSHNRCNLFSITDHDHGNGSQASLREQVQSHLWSAGIDANGPIRLLAMPRILGYAFNPLSIYFCHRQDESLAAILYEVNNTFGQRHNYLIPVAPGSNRIIRQQSCKSLYVSPFMTTDMTYFFAVVPPREGLAVSVTGHDAKGPLIVAKLVAARHALTDACLVRAFLLYPLLTLKVIIAIHFEALLLWLKGVHLQRRPPPPDRKVTVGQEKLLPNSTGMKDQDHVLEQ